MRNHPPIFKTVLFLSFILVYLATAFCALYAFLAEQGLVDANSTQPSRHLTLLLSAVIAETAAAVFALWHDLFGLRQNKSPQTAAAHQSKTQRNGADAPKTLLFVDDDLFSLMPITDQIKRLNHAVLTANTIEDAKSVIKERHDEIDLIVLDIRLPESKNDPQSPKGLRAGLSLAHEIKENYPAIKMIGLSGVHDNDAISWFEEFGNGYLKKPQPPIDVARFVLSALGCEYPGINTLLILYSSKHEGFAKLTDKLAKAASKQKIVRQPFETFTLMESPAYVDAVLIFLPPISSATEEQPGHTRLNDIFVAGEILAYARSLTSNIYLISNDETPWPTSRTPYKHIHFDATHEIQIEEIERALKGGV